MKITVAFLLIISSLGVSAQVNIDSLMAVWNDPNQPDTIRLIAIHSIAWNGYLHSQPDSAYYFAQLQYDFAKAKGAKKEMAKALNTLGASFWIKDNSDSAHHYYSRSLAIKEVLSDKKEIAISLNNIGLVHAATGEYTTAIDYYLRALTLFEEIGFMQGIFNSLNNMGICYANQGDYTKALEIYNQNLTLREEIGDKKGIGSTLMNIGIVHMEHGDFANAIVSYTRSLALVEETGEKKSMAGALINIGLIYQQMHDHAKTISYLTRGLAIAEEIGAVGRMSVALSNIGGYYHELEKYDSAIHYLSKGLAIAEDVGNKPIIGDLCNNLGAIYYAQEDFDKAMVSYRKSLAIMEEINNQPGMAVTLAGLGNVHLAQGRHDMALSYCTRALTMAKEIGHSQGVRNAAHALYEIYKTENRSNRALEMFELYTSAKDSIESEENQRAVIRLEYKYEYEKLALADSIAFAKEQAVKDAELEKSRIQQYALYGGITFLLAFLLYVYNRYRVTREQKLIIAGQNEEITTALEALRVAQAQLIQSEKMASLGQLTAGIAHEINNPLNFINISSIALGKDLEDMKNLVNKYREGLIEGTISKEELLEFEKSIDFEYLQKALKEEIEAIKEGTRRTTEIVKGLREFSHSNHVQLESVDIHHGIDVTLNLLKSRINENVRITKNYDQTIGEIKSHAGQLNQVLMNLLANAIEAVGEKGEIVITTKRVDDNVMISVNDDGPGIREENKTKVFDPFFTTKEIGKGTGLGLSISHGIIENHGGKIEVVSQEGVGTEFVISLPTKQKITEVKKGR